MDKAAHPQNQASIYQPIKLPDDHVVFDFTSGFDREQVERTVWGIGRYDEPRPHGMYTSSLYEPGRHIHMGVDLWAPAGTAVHSPLSGHVSHLANHAHHRDYGPTVITKHIFKGKELYVLFGHLSVASLNRWSVGDSLEGGEVVGRLGTARENGDWPPHLHLQLSWRYPKDSNMPGVVTAAERVHARKMYPDPRILLGPIY